MDGPHLLLIYDYVPDIVERRGPHREAHLAYARSWKEDGRIVAAGATGDPPSGALDSATFAASCPVAMNIAVMPLAECAPLLLTPDMKPPRLETWRARYISCESERMMRWKSSLGIVASAMTRLPRVRSMLTC